MEIHHEMLGGPGTIVEVNEAKFGKHKYKRARYREGKWVLGGIERGTDKTFFTIVPARDAATLVPIITQYVLPGTEIHMDEWRSYAQLNASGFIHKTVNHSVNFVDPASRAYTQTIESTWAQAKSKYKRMHGTSNELFSSYLIEYLWRRKYGKETPFAMFINCLT